MKVKVISLPYIFQVLYVLCFTRPRYQVSGLQLCLGISNFQNFTVIVISTCFNPAVFFSRRRLFQATISKFITSRCLCCQYRVSTQVRQCPCFTMYTCSFYCVLQTLILINGFSSHLRCQKVWKKIDRNILFYISVFHCICLFVSYFIRLLFFAVLLLYVTQCTLWRLCIAFLKC